MTPYTSSAPVTKPATPPPSYQVKDAPRVEKKQAQETSESSAKSYLNENESDISSPESSAFAEMMASLLGMPPLAQMPPPVNTGTIANDTVATISANSAATVTSSSTPRFGALFNMDPALLVLPQDVSATALIPPSDGSFSAELVAALTPGVPAPTEASSISSTPVTVPVPVIASEIPVTPALTVDTTAEADPRLIACGLDPVRLGELKEKISVAVNGSTDKYQTTNSTTPPIRNTAQAEPVNPLDKGVITVTFQPPEISATTSQTSPVGNVAVAVATQMSASQSTPVATTIAAATYMQSETPSSDIDMDAELLAAIEPGIEETSQDTGFDPVEFRIAQRFQHPASQTTSQATTTPAETYAPQSPVVNANSSPAPNAETGIKGKIPAQMDNTASLPSTAAAITTSSSANLTVSPVALPVTVTPMTVAASPVAQGSYASQAHPAIQTVAAAIAKNAKESGPQTISLRLDPPELGKLQVEMKYKKGDPLKVHVVLEKADTANLFQKDAHALENALKDAGVQMDGSSLSFEFSEGNSAFRQAMDQGSSTGNARVTPQTASINETPTIESSVNIYTDNKTGLTHYNLRV